MVQISAVAIVFALTCAGSLGRQQNRYDVKGKVALVTGGNRGIGLSIATELLANGAKGVSVIGINADRGRNAVKLLNAKFGPGKAIFLAVDVSNARQFEDAFIASTSYWGCLDIVINNAGILNEINPTASVNTNVMGVVQGTLLAMKHMSVSKGGRGGVIINISSIYGIDPMFIAPVYSGTKSFVIGFSRALGNENYYDYNKVRVITLCPGLSKTDIVSKKQLLNGISDDFKPGLKEISYKYLGSIFTQSPEYLGKAAIVLIKTGASGSVWVSEDEQPPYEVEFPDRLSMKKQL